MLRYRFVQRALLRQRSCPLYQWNRPDKLSLFCSLPIIRSPMILLKMFSVRGSYRICSSVLAGGRPCPLSAPPTAPIRKREIRTPQRVQDEFGALHYFRISSPYVAPRLRG